jgi:chromosome segregation ATPase
MPESPMMARRNSATPNSAGDGGVHKEALERQEREYQLYKREAGERERMHQAKIDALQADVTKLTAVNAKLESEMIYHQERFAVLVRNSDTAKDQLRASEERCTVLKTREAGYERQIQQTRDMLFDVQEQLSRVKVECQSLTDKLRLNETQAQRLQSELDVERQQSKQNDKLMEQLKALNVSVFVDCVLRMSCCAESSAIH